MVQMWSMVKTKLSYYVRLDQVWSMTKTKQDNDMIDCTGAVYVENIIEFS